MGKLIRNLRRDLGLDPQEWTQVEASVKYELHQEKNYVGLEGRKGQQKEWDLWMHEFLLQKCMDGFKGLKKPSELSR